MYLDGQYGKNTETLLEPGRTGQPAALGLYHQDHNTRGHFTGEFASAVTKFLSPPCCKSVLMSAERPQFSQTKAQANDFCTLK